MPGSTVEGGLHRSVRSLPAIKPDRLKTARARVEKAVRLQRVFSVQGPYPVIRAALWARGWVERRLLHPDQKAPCCYGDGRQDGDDGDASSSATETVDEGEKKENHDLYDLISHLVRNERTYFYWTTRRDYIDCRSLRNDQMTNHFGNTATFATKVGLCMNLRNLHWFDTADPNTFFPRCYRLGAEDEKHAFIEDFRRTACSSLLQHVVQTSKRRDGAEVDKQNAINTLSEEMKCVGPGVITTALLVCQDFLNVLAHCDIDVETAPAVDKQQWTEFLQDYYKVVHEGAWIKGSGVFVERCQAMLLRLQDVCPQLDTDGVNNIWIIKPGAMSRGRGIMCMNRLDEILALVDTDRAFAKESKWVVQKYLERPLLVNGTKFDLRQWFLVTDWNPLTVWFYSECYLRFSTQPYSTTTLDSSVHLCNNSIQKHFQPSHDRHPGVPKDSMWSCSQFRAFLEQQGHGAEWDSVVVPGMRRAVVHALQTAQELVEPRRASFELYGADFMLGSNLRPWLLEINVSPTMACSTSVTARLCPAVQLDTLRVVLDRRNNPSAYTGGFQLIYKQPAVKVPQCVGVSLLVEGSQIRRPRLSLQKTKVISNTPLCSHYSSFEVEMTHKPSCQKSAAFFHSIKENQAVRGKKKQLKNLSVCPQREREGRTLVCHTSCDGRSCVSLEQSMVLHSEPQRKAKCLALGSKRATLVPRSLCFSFTPLQNISDLKAENKPSRRSQNSRSFLHHAAPETQHRNSTELSRLQCRLPALEVFSLQPNILAGTTAFPDSTFATRSRFHRQQLLPRSYRQTVNQCKREHVNRSKICAE